MSTKTPLSDTSQDRYATHDDLLLPGEDSAVRPRMLRWLNGLKDSGDLDDTAVMKAFGGACSGVFAMPSSVARKTAAQFRLAVLGQTDHIIHQTFAISGERRIRHPGVAAPSPTQ
jgi:LysR family transcriptional activator of nhaA